ncbi:MAG: cytochrome c biogenesis protein ResB [Acidobacteriota bacterium]
MAAELSFFFRKFWQLISSIKTGVILLIVVVVVSAAGTIILQRPMTEPDEMTRAYSPQMLRILDATGLTNVFHSWWFVTLLVLVSLSIVAASIERFPNAWRYFSRPYKVTDASFRRVLPTQKQLAIPSEGQGLAAAERALRQCGFKAEMIPGKTPSLFAERNRLSEMAVYIVHASLLLIFLGGIVDGVWGWRGYISLERGQQVTQVPLKDGGTKALPFAIRCEGAGQENYKDGSPKRWWSKLAVMEGGREVQRKEIVVNDPLVYGGVRFYQSGYGSTGKVEQLLLTASSRENKGQLHDIALTMNTPVQLDADTTVRLARFIPDYFVRDGEVYNRSERVENPAVQMFVESKKTGKSIEVWLPEIEGFAHNAESPYTFEAKDLQLGSFTGLQVSYEPGQWAVWAGCLLMGLGLATAFYLVHIRFWVVPVRDTHEQLMLWFGGTANKNREAFQHKFDAFAEKLEQELAKQSEVGSDACAQAHATTLAGD